MRKCSIITKLWLLNLVISEVLGPFGPFNQLCTYQRVIQTSYKQYRNKQNLLTGIKVFFQPPAKPLSWSKLLYTAVRDKKSQLGPFIRS